MSLQIAILEPTPHTNKHKYKVTQQKKLHNVFLRQNKVSPRVAHTSSNTIDSQQQRISEALILRISPQPPQYLYLHHVERVQPGVPHRHESPQGGIMFHEFGVAGNALQCLHGLQVSATQRFAHGSLFGVADEVLFVERGHTKLDFQADKFQQVDGGLEEGPMLQLD
jgi:hypothetical protein